MAVGVDGHRAPAGDHPRGVVRGLEGAGSRGPGGSRPGTPSRGSTFQSSRPVSSSAMSDAMVSRSIRRLVWSSPSSVRGSSSSTRSRRSAYVARTAAEPSGVGSDSRSSNRWSPMAVANSGCVSRYVSQYSAASASSPAAASGAAGSAYQVHRQIVSTGTRGRNVVGCRQGETATPARCGREPHDAAGPPASDSRSTGLCRPHRSGRSPATRGWRQRRGSARTRRPGRHATPRTPAPRPCRRRGSAVRRSRRARSPPGARQSGGDPRPVVDVAAGRLVGPATAAAARPVSRRPRSRGPRRRRRDPGPSSRTGGARPSRSGACRTATSRSGSNSTGRASATSQPSVTRITVAPATTWALVTR